MRLLALTFVVSACMLVGCAKQDDTTAKANEATDVAVTPASSKLVMKVPTMSCPHGCWPTVKKTLEEQQGVASVELAKQSEEDTIDKPEVTIYFNGNFDAPAAIDALSKNGFSDAEVLN